MLSAGMMVTGITIIMAVATLPVRRSLEVSSVSGWALRSHPAAVITRRRRCITEHRVLLCTTAASLLRLRLLTTAKAAIAPSARPLFKN